jgi:predicted aldo/keto reductase-like oxidoreductase
MSQDDPTVSRRTFVCQTGLLAAGAALGAVAAQAGAEPPALSSGELPLRPLGKTGVSVSMLTLGTAPTGFTQPHSPQHVADCVNAAIDLGVNFIDTARAYDVAEEGVGLGLGRRRKDVFLATKVMVDTVADAERSFSQSLRLLKTDHVDLLYFHHVGDRKVEIATGADGVFTWILKQKKAGKTRFAGISGHNRPHKFTRLLETGEVDVLMAALNFVDRHTYNFEEKVLPVARKHEVGIVAMKVFGGSRNGNYPDPKCPPQLNVEHLELAVRYALGLPGVATLNIGVHNIEQLRKNVEMVKRYQPLTAEERAKCLALGKELAGVWGQHLGPLTYAGHLRSATA